MNAIYVPANSIDPTSSSEQSTEAVTNSHHPLSLRWRARRRGWSVTGRWGNRLSLEQQSAGVLQMMVTKKVHITCYSGRPDVVSTRVSCTRPAQCRLAAKNWRSVCFVCLLGFRGARTAEVILRPYLRFIHLAGRVNYRETDIIYESEDRATVNPFRVVSKQLLKIGMAHPLSGELRTFKKDMFDCQMCIAASTERSIVASQEIPVGSVGMAYTQPAQEDLFQPVSAEGRHPGFDGGFELPQFRLSCCLFVYWGLGARRLPRSFCAHN